MVQIIQVGSTSKNYFCFVLKEQPPFQNSGSTSGLNGHLRKEERWAYKLWADTGQRLFRSETVQTGLPGFSCGVATMKTKWLRRCDNEDQVAAALPEAEALPVAAALPEAEGFKSETCSVFGGPTLKTHLGLKFLVCLYSSVLVRG